MPDAAIAPASFTPDSSSPIHPRAALLSMWTAPRATVRRLIDHGVVATIEAGRWSGKPFAALVALVWVNTQLGVMAIVWAAMMATWFFMGID